MSGFCAPFKCAKNSVGLGRQSHGFLFMCKMFIRVTYNIIFEKIGGKLKEIGRKSFRVKYFITKENVVFAVGPCYKNCKLSKATLAAQEFARAQLQNSDFDLKLSLDSFTVIINSITIITNYGNKLNEKIKRAFTLLLNNDIVVFKNIYTKLPEGKQIELDPLVIEIIEEKL